MRLFHTSLYRFIHSRTVKYFFVIYVVLCMLSLTSMFSSAVDLYTQSIMDMSIPALGLSIFSSIYLGAEFKNRTIQNQISHGQKRSSLLLVNYFILLFVFLLLVYLYAALPTLFFYLQTGSMGTLTGFEEGSNYTSYLIRLSFPATLLTLARASGLFIFPFLFKDIVKTMLVSIVYSLIIPLLTQSNRFSYPYKYYWPGEFSLQTDISIVGISILILAIFYFIAYSFFKRSPLK